MPKKQTLSYSASQIDELLGMTEMNKETLTIAITGATEITTAGEHSYAVNYGLSVDKEIELVDVQVALDKAYDNVSLKDITNNSFKLNVTSFKQTEVVAIKLTAKEKHSGISVQNLNVTLRAIPVSDLIINGSDNLNVVGNAEYSLSPTPNNANIGIADLSVEVGTPQTI